jgi:acyl transferase domain-containing protein
LTRTEIAQPALGVVESALWRLLQRFGFEPDMAAGHSYGEYVALYAASVLTLDDLLQVSEARGRSIVEAAQGRDLGTMAAVKAEREVVVRALAAHPEVTVANHNAPQQTILSGPPAAIDAVVAALKKQGIQAQRLPVGAAFHSPLVAPARDALAAHLDTVALAVPRFPVYSNTTAAVHADDGAQLRATLAEHLGRPVEFVAEIEAMYAAGARVFLDVGPKNVMANLVDQILGDRPHRAVRLDDSQGGLKGLLNALGALFAEGIALDFTPLYRNRTVR